MRELHTHCQCDNSELPKMCPLDKTLETSVAKCVCCCYLKELRFGDIRWYCYADRVERGLPDYR
jgi:hypothetical protein